MQLRGRRQIAEPRKYCLVRVIVFFDVCFLYLFCFSQVGILVKFPTVTSIDTKSGDGIEAWICLKEEDMVKFEMDKEVLTYVSLAKSSVF